MAQVIELHSLNQLVPYRMVWNRLFLETPGASFFQTSDWLELYWHHFGEGQQLKVLVVELAGEAVGIVPLCVRQIPHKLATLRTVSYPLDNWGTTYGPIGSNRTASLMMAMGHLATSPRDWDAIELQSVSSPGDRIRTERAMSLAGLNVTHSNYQSSAMVDLRGTWKTYLASRDRKSRHEMVRHLRRAEDCPHLEFIRYRPAPFRAGDGDPRWDLYDQCEQVARASLQASASIGNTLCHPRTRQFYRDTHAAAARLGMVDMSLLRLFGQPVAFLYSYHHQGRLFGLRMGFDPTISRTGLGTQLLLMTLRDSFARGDVSFELGPGNQRYKQRLRTRVETTSRLVHVPELAFKGQLVRAAQWLSSRGRRIVGVGAN